MKTKLWKIKKAGRKIIIITARPNWRWSKWITEKLLNLAQIPFDKIYYVGSKKGIAKRKLEILKKENIKVFIDDNEDTIEYIQKFSAINARLP